jgi:putative ABC transport system ATP-binding protein
MMLVGPSGCGKTTLISIIAGILDRDAGECTVFGTDCETLGQRRRTLWRGANIGFVFQAFNLLPTLTAEENILLPLQLAGRKVDRAWYDAVVERVGLTDRTTHRPSELSGGQQQRVAVARALVSEPTVLFADEPTGNLDSKSSHEVLELLRDAAATFGQTTVMVTHDNDAAAAADRLIHLEDGQVVTDEVTR